MKKQRMQFYLQEMQMYGDRVRLKGWREDRNGNEVAVTVVLDNITVYDLQCFAEQANKRLVREWQAAERHLSMFRKAARGDN